MKRNSSGLVRKLVAVVADDDPDMRSLVARVLRREGLFVIEVTDGDDLAEFGAEDARASFPDVVVTDFQMPGRTGVEAVRALRKRGLTAPVLLMSSELEALDPELLGELGIGFRLGKPCMADALRRCVRCILTELTGQPRRASDPGVAPAEPREASGAPRRTSGPFRSR